jgi:hypothetical protein
MILITPLIKWNGPHTRHPRLAQLEPMLFLNLFPGRSKHRRTGILQQSPTQRLSGQPLQGRHVRVPACDRTAGGS